MNKLGSDAEVASFKAWLVDLLKREVVEVQFVKGDESIRTMLCTLKDDLLPPRPPVSDDEPVKPAKPDTPYSVNVYDVEAKAWRSFKTDRITSVTLSLMAE